MAKRITVDEKICNKHGLSMAEVFYLLLATNKIHIPTLVSQLPKKLGIASPLIEWQYFLTDEGNDLLSTILIESEPDIQKEGDRFDKLADKLRELYPNGKKDNVYHWRDSTKVIAKRLRLFAKKYGSDFTDEQAIEATKRYVESFNGNYKYMQLLKYFIMKNTNDGGQIAEVSQLLSYMENADEDVQYNVDWEVQMR